MTAKGKKKQTAYSYKIESSDCLKAWKNKRRISNVYDKLVDGRRKDGRGQISCACCMPPKTIKIRLVSQGFK